MNKVSLLEREIAVSQLEDGFSSIRICEIEISTPLPDISAIDEQTGQQYRHARCLIRLHTQPLGLLDLPLHGSEAKAETYVGQLWQALGEQINLHLREDGLPGVTGLDATGLLSTQTPRCIQEREAFLQTAPFVSVVLSTRDRPDHLARCLPSLLSLHYPNYEVIVVDSAPSTSATANLIQQRYADEPRIKYVCENRPGLSLARNCGIMVARGEILAFTDDDVVVDSYWLAELVKAFSSEDNVACVTGLCLPLELEFQTQVWFEEFGGFTKGFTRRVFDRTSRYTDIPLYPFAAGQFGTGASMAFTSAFLHRIGGFDPVLGAGTQTGGGEDLSAFFQVITSGYRLVYEPASLLYHLHRRDYIQLRKQIYYCGVSLMAFLTKIVFNNPLLLFDIIAKVPHGLFFIFSSRSKKNKKRSKNYPKDLITLERIGMLYGPFAYLRSLWEMHKLKPAYSSQRCPSAEHAHNDDDTGLLKIGEM